MQDNSGDLFIRLSALEIASQVQSQAICVIFKALRTQGEEFDDATQVEFSRHHNDVAVLPMLPGAVALAKAKADADQV